MSTPHRFVLLAGAVVTVGCGGSTTATSKQFDDASTGSGGSGGTSSSTGGSTNVTDASSNGVAVSCSDPSVSHVVETTLPQSPLPPGTGGTPAVSVRDGGRLPGLPTDPCVTYVTPACPGDPRSIFGCPVIRGPSGSSMIHPGDQITVTVPMSDGGLASYSCFGILSNNALIGGFYLTYAVKPAYAQATGQVPPSLKPGAVIHLAAEASGASPGTACSNDLTRIEFDATVE